MESGYCKEQGAMIFRSLCTIGCIGLMFSTGASTKQPIAAAEDIAPYLIELISKSVPESVIHNYSSVLVGRFNYWQDMIRRSVTFEEKRGKKLSLLNNRLFLQHESFALKPMHPGHALSLLKDAKIGVQNWDIIQTMNHGLTEGYKLGSGFFLSKMNTYLSKEQMSQNNWYNYSYGSGKAIGIWAGLYLYFNKMSLDLSAGNLQQDLSFASNYKVIYKMNYFVESSTQYYDSSMYEIKLPMSEAVMSKEPQKISLTFLNFRAKYELSLSSGVSMNLETNVLVQGIRIYGLTQYINHNTVFYRTDSSKPMVVQFDQVNNPGKFLLRDGVLSVGNFSVLNSLLQVEPTMTYSVPMEFSIGFSAKNILTDSMHIKTYVAGSFRLNALNPSLPNYYYSYLQDKINAGEGEKYLIVSTAQLFAGENRALMNAVTYGLQIGMQASMGQDFELDISYKLLRTSYKQSNNSMNVVNLSHGFSVSLNFEW